MGPRLSDFPRRRQDHMERLPKWDNPPPGRPPLQLEEEFKGVNMPMRNQFFRENSIGRRRELEEPSRQRDNFNMDLLERELETEMMEDRRRHMLEMDRRQYYSSPYGPSFEDAESLRGRRRKMPWTENWEQIERSQSRKGWVEDSQREMEESSQKLPSVAQYEEMLRERERLVQSQRKKDLEIENYRRQLQRLGIRDQFGQRKENLNDPPRSFRERGPLRRRPVEPEREVSAVKVMSNPRSNRFLSMSQEKRSQEKNSMRAKNVKEDSQMVGFKKIELDKPENPHPRVKISYTRMDEVANQQESDSDPGRNFSRVEVKVMGDKVEVVKNDGEGEEEEGGDERGDSQGAPEMVFEGEEEVEDFGEDILQPKKLESPEKKSENGEEVKKMKIEKNSEEKQEDVNQASGEFRLKIAKKSGAVRIAENQPQVSSSLKNLNNIGRRSLSLDDIEPEEILGNKNMRDKSTQTKDNPVIKFLGQHSLNKLSSLLKKNDEMTESQMLYISQKRGKGRPHKNKENAPFHCLLNKDKETIITEELDNIISSFVVCSLQDKQVSLKIKDFSFWMKNRLFEVISTNETFETQSLNLIDLTPDFLKSISSKLLDKCFDQKFIQSLQDFRGVFMLDFLVYNTIKTRLITETVSLNFNTLNRLRNSQELTLPMVLASFVFLVSNFLIPSKFEMFYTYSCFLFSTLFQHSITSCILHLSGRSTQLEFSIQKLAVAANSAQEDIERAYQKFVNGGAPFNQTELKTFIESEKQLQFNSLLVHYIGIFAMLLE